VISILVAKNTIADSNRIICMFQLPEEISDVAAIQSSKSAAGEITKKLQNNIKHVIGWF
jgi:hypothetical protein